MWIEPHKCKHYHTLQELLRNLQTVFSKIDFQELRNDPAVTNWSTDNADSWHTNWSINLYHCANSIKVPDAFVEVTEKIATMDQCYQVFLNFVAPNTIIPKHKDNKNLGNIVGPAKACYQVVLGIQIPSNDPAICGFENDGVVRSYNTGDIVAFDGMADHWGWNYSTEWRITACVDIFTEAFDPSN